ncbi:MAG TPA: HAD family hydrolase [Gemmatimonadaceae bacterium]|nr:HAD family hydrolase [Gemmatimonadaceae bacterium]
MSEERESAPVVSALFLDRDGTINEDTAHVSKPDNVRLIPGAGEAIARLNAAGIPVIVVTNQSGIGRGLFTVDDYAAVSARIDELLGALGARIDATYVCPHAPTDACDCRKPRTQLYSEARDDRGIELARAWFVGDRLRDIEPAAVFGGRGILVPRTSTPEEDIAAALARFSIEATLEAAVARALGEPLTPPWTPR